MYTYAGTYIYVCIQIHIPTYELLFCLLLVYMDLKVSLPTSRCFHEDPVMPRKQAQPKPEGWNIPRLRV